MKMRPQTAHQRNFSELHKDVIYEKKSQQRPMSGRSAGGRFKGKHRRLQSAAAGGQKRYDTS